MSDSSEQEPSYTMEELKKALHSEVSRTKRVVKLALRFFRRKRGLSRNLALAKMIQRMTSKLQF